MDTPWPEGVSPDSGNPLAGGVDGATLEVVQQLCECSPLSARLRAHFEDVVLVVNTNYEFAVWGTAAFWRRTFGRFFRDVLIISPRGVAELNVTGEEMDGCRVLFIHNISSDSDAIMNRD